MVCDPDTVTALPSSFDIEMLAFWPVVVMAPPAPEIVTPPSPATDNTVEPPSVPEAELVIKPVFAIVIAVDAVLGAIVNVPAELRLPLLVRARVFRIIAPVLDANEPATLMLAAVAVTESALTADWLSTLSALAIKLKVPLIV